MYETSAHGYDLDVFDLDSSGGDSNLDNLSSNTLMYDNFDISDVPLSQITRQLSHQLGTHASGDIEGPNDNDNQPGAKVNAGRMDGLNFVKWLLADVDVLPPKEQKALTDKVINCHVQMYQRVIQYAGSRRLLLLLCDTFASHGIQRDFIADKMHYFRLKQDYSPLFSTRAKKDKTMAVLSEVRQLTPHANSAATLQHATQHALHFPRTFLLDIIIFCLRSNTQDETTSNPVPTGYVTAPFSELFQTLKISNTRKKLQLSYLQKSEMTHCVQQYFALRNKLITHNIPLVIKLAREGANTELGAVELIQEGIAGLIRAAEKYTNTRGTRFSTYAFNWIDSKIRAAKVNQNSIIKLSPEVNIELNKLISAREAIITRGHKATDENIAAHMGVKKEKVQWLNDVNRNTLSIHYCYNDNESSDAEMPLPDTVSTEESAHALRVQSQLDAVIQDELPIREQTLLAMRFGLKGYKPHTIEAIGKVLSLSPERIRQLEENSLVIINDALMRKGWKTSEG